MEYVFITLLVVILLLLILLFVRSKTSPQPTDNGQLLMMQQQVEALRTDVNPDVNKQIDAISSKYIVMDVRRYGT